MAANFSGTCELPLVATENENSWYNGVDGCGIQCTNPLFTDAEHKEVHTFIAVMGSLCLLCSLFTIVSTTVLHCNDGFSICTLLTIVSTTVLHCNDGFSLCTFFAIVSATVVQFTLMKE